MQFLYPIFLIAGLSLLIPILIHLFNLRRYKTVFFPHTRFLKSLQLHSRKQSQVRYKWLLAARLLFLLFLILAFMQPFLGENKKSENKNALTIIYIDNSQSMSLQSGARNLLDIAKEQAQDLINKSAGSFLVLTNDKPSSYMPIQRQQAIDVLNDISLSYNSKTSTQILNEVNSMVQDRQSANALLYYLSDFQQNSFATSFDKKLLKDIRFNGVQISQKETQNIYIDTAFFENPVLNSAVSNKLIVRTKYYGDAPKVMPVLQLSVDNKVKSAATVEFNKGDEHYDTLSFQANDNKWQKILLTINDAKNHFDDSFRVAARSSSELSVLLISEGRANIFLQAALRSYKGFRVKECSVNQIPDDIGNYNLIVANGLTKIENQLASALQKALQNGQNVCLFFGDNAIINGLNNGLNSLGDLSIQYLDTIAQSVSSLQSESRLLIDMFERIPENVQLPYSQKHYQIKAGLSANQQSIFSFRNGDPFFANYSLFNGQLYICATPIEPQYGNFQSSYFFVPFLYQMASIAKGNHIYAITAGQKQAVFIPQKITNERALLHIKADGTDIIPPQKAEGMGVKLFVGEVVNMPDFYSVSGDTTDSIIVAINLDRAESKLTVWSIKQLQENWKGNNISWQIADSKNRIEKYKSQTTFPLWKLCSILALLMLSLETYLLSKNIFKKQTITN